MRSNGDTGSDVAKTTFPGGRTSEGVLRDRRRHYQIPSRDEIVDEFLLAVGAAVDFGQGTQLGMGAEDQIDSRGGPLDRAGGAVAAFEEVGFHSMEISRNSTPTQFPIRRVFGVKRPVPYN